MGHGLSAWTSRAGTFRSIHQRRTDGFVQACVHDEHEKSGHLDLCSAVAFRQPSLVQYLIEKRGHQPDPYHFQQAVINGNVSILRYLTRHGMQKDKVRLDEDMEMLARQLDDIIPQDSVATRQDVILRECQLLQQRVTKGFASLPLAQYCLRNQHIDMLRFLLKDSIHVDAAERLSTHGTDQIRSAGALYDAVGGGKKTLLLWLNSPRVRLTPGDETHAFHKVVDDCHNHECPLSDELLMMICIHPPFRYAKVVRREMLIQCAKLHNARIANMLLQKWTALDSAQSRPSSNSGSEWLLPAMQRLCWWKAKPGITQSEEDLLSLPQHDVQSGLWQMSSDDHYLCDASVELLRKKLKEIETWD